MLSFFGLKVPRSQGLAALKSGASILLAIEKDSGASILLAIEKDSGASFKMWRKRLACD
jgi:hypothetical protein